MKELIDDAFQLIEDKYDECKLIDAVLNWDDEMKIAFKLAWRIYHEEEKRKWKQ